MESEYEENSTSLFIKSLRLQNFRNYKNLELSNLGKLSIFVGENAVGKTSIIEAIQLLTDLKSFRATNSEQLILWGENESNIQSEFFSNKRSLTETLQIKDNRRTYSLNGKKKTIQELKGLLPAVVFTPDDLTLVKGSNSQRRDALDSLGMQLSKNFYAVRSDYYKILKQKNKALKEESPKEIIQSFNDVLIKIGIQYILHRNTLLQAFMPKFQHAYTYITQQKEAAHIGYFFSWDVQMNLEQDINKKELSTQFIQAIQENFYKEIEAKRCLIGPHADHIDFYIANFEPNPIYRSSQLYASQGQQRSIVLAFKMAELNTIQDILQQKPVLLLDDVMSELDEQRRHAIMELIKGGIQAFITTTNLAYFNENILKEANVYTLPFSEQ